MKQQSGYSALILVFIALFAMVYVAKADILAPSLFDLGSLVFKDQVHIARTLYKRDYEHTADSSCGSDPNGPYLAEWLNKIMSWFCPDEYFIRMRIVIQGATYSTRAATRGFFLDNVTNRYCNGTQEGLFNDKIDIYLRPDGNYGANYTCDTHFLGRAFADTLGLTASSPYVHPANASPGAPLVAWILQLGYHVVEFIHLPLDPRVPAPGWCMSLYDVGTNHVGPIDWTTFVDIPEPSPMYASAT